MPVLLLPCPAFPSLKFIQENSKEQWLVSGSPRNGHHLGLALAATASSSSHGLLLTDKTVTA